MLAGRGAGYAQVRERVLALLTGRYEQADPKTRLVRLPVPAGLADATEQLRQVQRQKTAAFEAGDFDSAAALRVREKQLRAEKLRLEHEWAAGVDVRAVIAENQRVHRELDRLRDLLRRTGGTMNPASLRADAAGNRARIIAAARAAVANADEVKLNAIAKQAGVGQGTLYRHFPTREALLAEVYREDVGDLVAAAPALLARHEPLTALAR